MGQRVTIFRTGEAGCIGGMMMMMGRGWRVEMGRGELRVEMGLITESYPETMNPY